MAIDFGGEEDLPKASKEAGYKISVNSPEGMAGVEGLTHDHLMEISAGVFMKFKHAYVVGGVDEKGVELLDPHGEVEVKNKEEKLYSPALVTLIEQLSEQIIRLEEELKISEYKEFSVTLRDQLDNSMHVLKEKSKLSRKGGKEVIEELRKNWARLNNKSKLIKENGKLTGLRPKNVQNLIGTLLQKKKELAKEDIGKGFEILPQGFNIKGRQKTDYNLIKTFFESVRINKIKK